MSKNSQHVIPGTNGWSVRKTGAAKASSTHATQAEAISVATRIARNQRAELYIHGSDGRIRERNSYADGARPSKH